MAQVIVEYNTTTDQGTTWEPVRLTLTGVHNMYMERGADGAGRMMLEFDGSETATQFPANFFADPITGLVTVTWPNP